MEEKDQDEINDVQEHIHTNSKKRYILKVLAFEDLL